MDSPVHWECREADQHTTLCYGRSIEVCIRFLERMRRAQVAFTWPDAIDYSAHDLAHSIPSYLSRGCIGRKRFKKKFHNGLPWTVPCLTDCRLLGNCELAHCWRQIASLTMSAVSSSFRAHFSMHSEKRAISQGRHLDMGRNGISVQHPVGDRPSHPICLRQLETIRQWYTPAVIFGGRT
jgi:hypothetical protein